MPETLSPLGLRTREAGPVDAPVLARPDDLERLLDDDGLAAWIADELMTPGAVLSPTAIDDAPAAPAIGRTAITTMMRHTLRDAHPLVARFLPVELRAEAALSGAGTAAHARLEQGARLLARLIAHYWAAVRTAYPQAWSDRDGHLLFSREGLTALSRFGAEVITARVSRHEILPEYFVSAMQPVAERVPLARASRPALAPHPAADQLLAELVAALRGADAETAAGQFPVRATWGSTASPISAPWESPASPHSPF